jgi:hypothetical protein
MTARASDPASATTPVISAPFDAQFHNVADDNGTDDRGSKYADKQHPGGAKSLV